MRQRVNHSLILCLIIPTDEFTLHRVIRNHLKMAGLSAVAEVCGVKVPGHKRSIHLHYCQLITQEGWPDGIECTVKVKKCDPHSACWLVQIGINTIEKLDDDIC